MIERLHFYIDGMWTAPVSPAEMEVCNPATEGAIARISLGSAADVDRAVAAARRAFVGYSECGVADRLAFLHRIIAGFKLDCPNWRA